jgi:low temperature requirement protein LtrA
MSSETDARAKHLRQHRGEEQRATNLELFFDLVFVFAITQLSHLLSNHLTVTGAAKTVFLLLVVWWGWTYTTWMTNFFDPDAIAVRLVLIGTMLASLLMAIAIPKAFDERALLFAAGYTSLQIVRNAFVLWATDPKWAPHRTFEGVAVWSVGVGALWIAGALVDDWARVTLWLAALAIDYAGPYARYWLPGRGRASVEEWEVESSHFAERFQLFIIIALGESIVVTGTTASDLQIDLPRATAIAVAFLGTAAMWWLYFSYVAAVAQVRLETTSHRGELARDAYTYLHAIMVAGIIVAAVGDEIVIAHPGAQLTGAQLVALAAGPALYLVGHVAFRLRMTGTLSTKRLAGSGAVVAGGVAGIWLPALASAALILGALIGVIVWEIVAAHRRWPEGSPDTRAVKSALDVSDGEHQNA